MILGQEVRFGSLAFLVNMGTSANFVEKLLLIWGPSADSIEGMAQSIDPEGAYSQIETNVFFESIVVHELAHAIFQQNASVSALCADNHDYVAHAMQMAWLPEDARAQIVQECAQEPPIDPVLLNGFIAAMAA